MMDGPYGGQLLPSPTGGQLRPLRRSPSGAGLLGEREPELVAGASGLRAVRTARLLQQQLEQLAPVHLLEVRKALAILQGAGIHEVSDVSGLHETVVAKLAKTPAHEGKEPEVMLAPALQAGLVFDFTQERLTHTDDIGVALAGLRTLRTLRLRFSRCETLEDVAGLGKGIRELSALKELHMDFGGCPGLTTMDELAKGIASLYGLDTLYLNFQGCSSLTLVKELANAIASLTSLKTLTLNFEGCGNLPSDTTRHVGTAISQLGSALIDLDLNVCGTKVKRGVQRPTILEPGPIGITNYMLQSQTVGA